MDDLETINRALQAKDDLLTSRFTVPEMPVTFLIEAGRCGSTVLIQLLGNAMRLGYVSRVLAKYWLAPYCGCVMEKEILRQEEIADFDFRYQKTMGPHEPNEWGWFWKHWLRLGKGQYYCTEPERIDGAGLCRKLAAMESVKQAPLFFDNVYAKANLDTLRGIIPNILVLRLRRDPYYVCNSHLNARLKCMATSAAAKATHPEAWPRSNGWRTPSSRSSSRSNGSSRRSRKAWRSFPPAISIPWTTWTSSPTRRERPKGSPVSWNPTAPVWSGGGARFPSGWRTRTIRRSSSPNTRTAWIDISTSTSVRRRSPEWPCEE